MEIFETTYEDMTIKSAQTVGKNTKTQKNNTKLHSIDAVYCEYEEIQTIDEAEEDIYEVIPADFAPSSWSEKTSRSSSISSRSSSRSERSCSVATVGIQTDEDSPSCSPETTESVTQDDDETAHYAEIHHVNDFEITEIAASRPTRESDNPLLRQDFAQLADSKLLEPELQTIRNSFAGISKQVVSHGNHAKELPAHLLLKRSLSVGDNRNGFVRKYVDVMYENTQPSPHDSPVMKHQNTSSATPVYENITFPLIESDRESHCSISSSSTEGKSVFSEEESLEYSNLYENVGDYANDQEPRARTRSRPIDIVYSDLEFHGERKIQTHSSSLESEELTTDISNSRKTKSLSAVQAKPSPPSPRGGSGLARPKSLNLRLSKSSNEALGLCRARFVKKVTVQRSNDKTLQATLCEVLSKSSNVEDEPFVNVEVNSDLVRISTDFPPWEVIASCDIETVGHVNLYEEDDNVLGIIVSPLGEESTCYIVRSQQASHILSTIKTAFRAPNLRVSILEKFLKLLKYTKTCHIQSNLK